MYGISGKPTVSFALPFLLSAFRLSLALALLFPLLLLASRSMDMSESEYISIGSSCFDMLGDWGKSEGIAAVQLDE